MDTASAGPGGTIDLAQEAATVIPLTQHAEQDGEVVLDEISDLKQLASDVTNKVAVDATPVPSIEAVTGTDDNSDQERDLAQEAATIIPLTQHAEQDGEVGLDEIPDIKRPTSDLADKVEVDVTSTPPLEIAMGDDGECGRKRDEAEIALGPAAASELVLSGLHAVEDDARSPPRAAAIASLRPASVPDAETCGGPGPALLDTPSVPSAGLAEDAPREDEHGTAVASGSEVAQSHEFADQDEIGVAEVRSGERAEDDDLAGAAEAEAEQSAAESVSRVVESAANPSDSEEPATEQATDSIDVLTGRVPEDAAADVGIAEETVRSRLSTAKARSAS